MVRSRSIATTGGTTGEAVVAVEEDAGVVEDEAAGDVVEEEVGTAVMVELLKTTTKITANQWQHHRQECCTNTEFNKGEGRGEEMNEQWNGPGLNVLNFNATNLDQPIFGFFLFAG